ncbi:hypothetical protein BGZ94_004281, partial [Podila epigama]
MEAAPQTGSSISYTNHNNIVQSIFSRSTHRAKDVPSTGTATQSRHSTSSTLDRHTLGALSTISFSTTKSVTSTRNLEFSISSSSRPQTNGHDVDHIEPPRKFLKTFGLTIAKSSPQRPQGTTKVLPINKVSAKSHTSLSNDTSFRQSVRTVSDLNTMDHGIRSSLNSSIRNDSTIPTHAPTTDYRNILTKSTLETTTDNSSTMLAFKETNDQLRKSIGSSALDFARKSLMQHATTAPQQAIRRVSKVTAESQGVPSILDLMSAPDNTATADPVETLDRGQGFEQSFAHRNSVFTFESAPLPQTQDMVGFTRPGPQFVSDEQQQGHLLTKGTTLDSGISGEPTRGPQGPTFDLWDTQHEDSRRTLHEPNRTSIPLKSTQSTAHQRSAPYKKPSVNERETLRAARKPGFRARPLDPKVFTSAGDLGVPRIKKLPLTVPVSPAFSKPRIRTIATAVTNGSERGEPTVPTRQMNMMKKALLERRPANRLGVQSFEGIATNA